MLTMGYLQVWCRGPNWNWIPVPNISTRCVLDKGVEIRLKGETNCTGYSSNQEDKTRWFKLDTMSLRFQVLFRGRGRQEVTWGQTDYGHFSWQSDTILIGDTGRCWVLWNRLKNENKRCFCLLRSKTLVLFLIPLLPSSFTHNLPSNPVGSNFKYIQILALFHHRMLLPLWPSIPSSHTLTTRYQVFQPGPLPTFSLCSLFQVEWDLLKTWIKLYNSSFLFSHLTQNKKCISVL